MPIQYPAQVLVLLLYYRREGSLPRGRAAVVPISLLRLRLEVAQVRADRSSQRLVDPSPASRSSPSCPRAALPVPENTLPPPPCLLPTLPRPCAGLQRPAHLSLCIIPMELRCSVARLVHCADLPTSKGLALAQTALWIAL